MISLKRSMNYFNKTYMYQTYANKYEIEKLNWFKLRKLYSLEEKKLIDYFLMNLLNDWIQKNYKETLAFVNKLKRYIKKFKLSLTVLEKEKLLLLDERIFSIDRHIKELQVSTSLDNRERVGAKFSNAKMFDQERIFEGNLLITNKRIIFEYEDSLLSFYHNNTKISCDNQGMHIKKSKANYLFKIHDQLTLKNTFENVKRRKVKI